MHCLSHSDFKAFLSRAGFRDADPLQGSLPGLARHACGSVFRLDGSQSMSVARGLVEWLWQCEPRSCGVLVVEYGVWPSSENLALYYAWRKSLQVTTTLDDAPGHQFFYFEMHEMISLVQLSLLFGWGVLAVSADGTSAFSFDDDGQVIAFADSIERAAEAKTALPVASAPERR